MATHTFRASDDLARAIDDRCLAENINKSQLLIRAVEQYLAGVIQPVRQDVIQTDIDDRFEALESKIEGIEQQLKTIVDSGKSPQKAKTIAPGTTPKAIVSWKDFIIEFPDKTIDELCEIARERYPDRNLKKMRDSIVRAKKNMQG
jgi:predicted transcriptional regulator